MPIFLIISFVSFAGYYSYTANFDLDTTIENLEKTSSNLNNIVSKDFNEAINNINKVAINFIGISEELGEKDYYIKNDSGELSVRNIFKCGLVI